MSGAAWKQQRERGSAFWIALLVRIAALAGRPLAGAVLWPVALFFVCTGSAARRASRSYLGRVYGHRASALQVLRHFHAFAVCTLDRWLILAGHGPRLDVRTHRPPAVAAATAKGRGAVVLVSHLGSFEVLRQLGAGAHGVPLRIVLDRSHGGRAIALLERLDPAFAGSIIDAGRGGPELVLALREALAAGCSVGIMADRLRTADEPSVPVLLLGGTVRLPAAPWVLAGVLGVPVVAAFGLYRGGGRYDAVFELLAERVERGRAGRDAAIARLAQDYAARLERHLRRAPYNWFNFFAYWSDEAAGD
ncbi:MAG: lipid A biosynthesis acyltransferase [Nevskia sp.]|nr:lipid A biosynthesis acyltransferase [Nevskia sp.]